MSLTVATLDAMLAAGCTAEQLAAVMKADIVERETAATIRRAKDADRQHRKRARHAESRGHFGQSVTDRDNADAPLSLSPNENNSNPHTHTPGNISPRARKDDFPRPEWADAQVWADFLKNRKTKRLPNTATAHEKFLTDVAKLSAETGWPPGECLRACVARGWGAIFDPREGSNGRSGQNIGRAQDRRDGVARALDRQLGLDDQPFDGRPTGRGGESGDSPVAYLAAVR